MDKYATFMRDLGDFQQGLYRPNFVVGVHDRNQRRTWSNSPAHIVMIDEPVPIYGQACYCCSTSLQKAARLKHGRMLDAARDNVKRMVGIAFAKEETLDDLVVGLCAARCKNNFR